MLREIRPSIVMIIALTAITGLAYPLAMTGIAGGLFPRQAQGSLIERDGKVVGSERIGQNFTSDRISTDGLPRPPARTLPIPRSRFPPLQRRQFRWLEPLTHQQGVDRSGARCSDTLKQENPSAPVPIELVTTSASGLDPDTTPQAALFQAPRVAKARNLPEIARQLVEQNIEYRVLGIFGEPRVNVLALNLALDRATRP